MLRRDERQRRPHQHRVDHGRRVASGDAVRGEREPPRAAPADNGGEIHVEAAQAPSRWMVRGSSRRVTSTARVGSATAARSARATAPIRAFNGPLSWATGTGDAQPTGGPLTGGATGAINLQGCGSVAATASFPVTAGAFSPTISTACGGAPTLPSYVVLPSNCSMRRPAARGNRGSQVERSERQWRPGSRDFGLSGWQIHLFAPGAPAETASTFTGDDGTYSFANLADGTYEVCESPTTGWTQTFPPRRASLDCQARTGGFGHSVTIVGGQVVSGVDFGNHFPIPSTGVKSGRKWNDLNVNGIRRRRRARHRRRGRSISSEMSIPPSTCRSKPTPSGNYSFTGLAPGRLHGVRDRATRVAPRPARTSF